MTTFHSNGKLLLTGEYFVLDGAAALALPTQKGQLLRVESKDIGTLVWQSFDPTQKRWFSVEFELPSLRIISEEFISNTEGGDDSVALKLKEILTLAQQLNPDFLASEAGYQAKSRLEFPRNWGLGSSSTLINNIAQWSLTDPFKLQFETFGGSAYDIACARSSHPIRYTLKEKLPQYTRAHFDPNFKDQLYFVFLNQKMNSREAILKYRQLNAVNSTLIDTMTELTDAIVNAATLDDFDRLLVAHEQLISSAIGKEPIQITTFSDYFGQTKSLGAWGGDFMLATGNDDTPQYFKKKGYNTVLSYQEMIL